jgi:pre-60S factor REI1
MNLNPLNFEEYTKKKEIYQKLNEAKAATNQSNISINIAQNCDVCRKTFLSGNKFNEHMISRAHKKAAENFALATKTPTLEKKLEEEKTTLDDVSICLFCNHQSDNLENNIVHMMDSHRFTVPLVFCVKNFKGMIKLMAKKVLTYVACLSCDAQNFKNYKGLQNHMVDKGHTSVSEDDLEEFFFKFYDKKNLLSIKDKGLKKTKEYKILKFKPRMKRAKPAKEEEGWSTVSENEEVDDPKILKKKDVKEYEEDSEDDYEPVALPNGELLLENGTIVGNKIYQIYYKQRFHQNRYDKLVDKLRVHRMNKIKKKPVRIIGPTKKYYTVKDSNKSSFARINTLFKARKQVNV